MDDFQRIYGGCLELPVMKAIVEIVRGQKDWAPDWAWSVRDLGQLMEHSLHCDFLSDFEEITKRIREEYDAVLGPRMYLEGPRVELDGVILTFDFDVGRDRMGRVGKGQKLRTGVEFEWQDSSFCRAALHYRRECHWDFPPGEAGIWLVYCHLTSSVGGGRKYLYTGNLVGFVVLHDRDKDGRYESLAHLWTARGARRKGVGRQLMERARRDYPLQNVEKPFTEAGRALTGAVWPEVIDGS